MTIALTDPDQGRFAGALQALLSPLAFPDPAAWAAAAGEAVRDLAHADSALVALPGLGFIEGAGLPGTVRSAYHHHFEGAMRGEPTKDPLALEFVRRRREAGVDVVDFAGVNELLGGRIDQSAFHHDAFLAGGIRDMHALYADAVVEGRPAEIAITACFAGPVGGVRSAKGLALLRMLKPAFQSGVETWLRVGAQGVALAAVFDGLGVALAVVDLRGRVRHQTPALTALLQAEPERARLSAAVQGAARAVGWAHGVRPSGDGGPPSPALDVATATARYHVRATSLGEGTLGAEPAAVVAVERVAPPEAPGATVAARYGLTRQEARVAGMLADRRTTREIAEALFISVHTVRHHVEHVMEKLGVRARTDIAEALSRR